MKWWASADWKNMERQNGRSLSIPRWSSCRPVFDQIILCLVAEMWIASNDCQKVLGVVRTKMPSKVGRDCGILGCERVSSRHSNGAYFDFRFRFPKLPDSFQGR